MLPDLNSVHRGVVAEIFPDRGARVVLEGPYGHGFVHASLMGPGGAWVGNIFECVSIGKHVYCSVLDISTYGEPRLSMSSVDQSTGSLLPEGSFYSGASRAFRMQSDPTRRRLPELHSVHRGAVTRVMNFGFFVRLDGDFDEDGLVHHSRIRRGYTFVDGMDIARHVPVGTQIYTVVTELRSDGKIELSMSDVDQSTGRSLLAKSCDASSPSRDSGAFGALAAPSRDTLMRRLVDDLHAWLISKRVTEMKAGELTHFIDAHPQYKTAKNKPIVKPAIVGFGASKLHYKEHDRGDAMIVLGPAPRPSGVDAKPRSSVVDAKADLSKQQVPQLYSIHRGVVTELLPNVGAFVALRGPFGVGLVPKSRIGPGGTPMFDFAQHLSVGSEVCCSVSEINRHGKFELTMSSVEAQGRQVVGELRAWLVSERKTEILAKDLENFLLVHPQYQGRSFIKSAIASYGEGNLSWIDPGPFSGGQRVAVVPSGGGGSVVSASSSSSPRSEQTPRRSPRDRSPSPEITCIQCGTVRTQEINFCPGNLFCGQACKDAHNVADERQVRALFFRRGAWGATKRPRTAENPSD